MRYFSYNQEYNENRGIYKTLAKEFHPSRGGKRERFEELQREWDFYEMTYKNPRNTEERKAYDQAMQKVSFIQIKDVKAFYQKNSGIIDQLASDLLKASVQKLSFAKKNKEINDIILAFGHQLGQSIIDELKK